MSRLSLPAIIRTERLLLQRLRYEDAEEIFYAYASKPEATRYVSWPTHRSVDDTRHYLRHAVEAWHTGREYAYSIRLGGKVLIGSIGAIHEEGKIQMGYVISPQRWGRGYPTEACSHLLALLKDMKGIFRIGTFVDADNVASIRVLTKCGMVEEARLPGWFRFVNQNNELKDCILFRWPG